MAKLLRAAADSMSRMAASQVSVPTERITLVADIRRAAEALSRLEVSADLLSALRQGADVMAQGGVPLFAIAPHPYVCRSCGHLTLVEPVSSCQTCGAWPDTFQRFMPNYWFDALEPPAALARLRQTPIEVGELLEGLSEAQVSQAPPDGGWAIRNVLSHLHDAQGVLSYRLDLFLREEHPALESKAVWAWATSDGNRPPSAREILEAYTASRLDILGRLEQLSPTDWWRTGRHEEFGTVTLRQQVSYFAAHELTHLPQIGALRLHWVASAHE